MQLSTGKGANQAVAAKRLGAAVRFVGRLGRDGHGEWCHDGELGGWYLDGQGDTTDNSMRWARDFFGFRWRLWVLRSVDADTFASKAVETRDDQIGWNRSLWRGSDSKFWKTSSQLSSCFDPARWFCIWRGPFSLIKVPDSNVICCNGDHEYPFQMLWLQGNPSKGIDLWSITGRGLN